MVFIAEHILRAGRSCTGWLAAWLARWHGLGTSEVAFCGQLYKRKIAGSDGWDALGDPMEGFPDEALSEPANRDSGFAEWPLT